MGKETPKVSVIIPVYNVEKYLGNCLDSIITQTLSDIEIICVNDGSTDNSLAILEEYAKRDSRILVVSKENDGLGAARNTGLEFVCGEYIGFVDSDDFVENTMFEKLYLKASKFDSDIVIANIFLYFDDTKETTVYRDIEFFKRLSECGCFNAKNEPGILQNIAAWDRIYKRSFLVQYNLKNPEHVIYEDAPFSFKTSVLAKRICVVDEPLYYYRKNTGVAITDKEKTNDKYKFDFLKNCKEIKAFLKKQADYDLYQEDFLYYQYLAATWHQGFMRTPSSFQKFFDEMRNMTESTDYDILKCWNNHFISTYAYFLKKNKLKSCSWFFWLKKHFKRDENYYYVRIFVMREFKPVLKRKSRF